ncbi:type I-C CRISPR-associated protein Cas8c/Csd1 [Paenibacillus sp. HJGM_3]|uniref:type I-C CRISPR-associated protein Cas8c/Csd1 n=1 Tax=Paenibacillus sp. HJGM_3 TaxID=3379816 RepID=UPI003859ED82
MIVQALYKRYLDLVQDPNSGVCEMYFSVGKAAYILELAQDGTLKAVTNAREQSGKKRVPRSEIVPEQASRSSGISPYFLCDKAEYLIGYAPPDAKKLADALKKYEASRELAQTILAGAAGETAEAILNFYSYWKPEQARRHPALQDHLADLDRGIDTNMVFRVQGAAEPAHRDPNIRDAWIRHREKQETESGYDAQCLATGQRYTAIARLHDKIKGVRHAQQAGATLVSFNFRSAESYGKDHMQSYNAPVSKAATFGYATALNHLLASPSNRLLLGDMTVVFWSGDHTVASQTEPLLASWLATGGMTGKAGATEPTEGTLPHADAPFYILGLAPNNARVSVRLFWHGRFGDLARQLNAHAADFSLAGPDEPRDHTFYPTLTEILEETRRVAGDGRKIGDGPPDRIGGELFRAVLQGTAYPYSLYTAILGRIRMDGIVNRLRASIVKGYLTRYCRIHNHNHLLKEGLMMSLNVSATEPAYRLGRLFSVLERAQVEAARPAKLHATIKDRYFQAAVTNPRTVFPNLLRLASSHTSKSEFGPLREREMAEILSGVGQFPARLNVQQQGLFMLGYYHQKQAAFAGKPAEEADLRGQEPASGPASEADTRRANEE